MSVFYFDSDTEVRVGDHVEFKVWLFFWRGWQKGRVYYVPGISPKNDELEYDGLASVAIEDKNGEQVGVVVEPDTGRLQKNVRFISRSDDDLKETPSNYYFGDEEPEQRETT